MWYKEVAEPLEGGLALRLAAGRNHVGPPSPIRRSHTDSLAQAPFCFVQGSVDPRLCSIILAALPDRAGENFSLTHTRQGRKPGGKAPGWKFQRANAKSSKRRNPRGETGASYTLGRPTQRGGGAASEESFAGEPGSRIRLLLIRLPPFAWRTNECNGANGEPRRAISWRLALGGVLADQNARVRNRKEREFSMEGAYGVLSKNPAASKFIGHADWEIQFARSKENSRGDLRANQANSPVPVQIDVPSPSTSNRIHRCAAASSWKEQAAKQTLVLSSA